MIALAMPLVANAAGMGKITVLSALGQPLRAELDISASREELSSLAARVAPVEAFKQANVEYAGVLSTVRFVLDKRADGRAYFKIQTDRAVNEPFIDFLVELSWSSGRMVREYAFLLDPPELKSDNAAVAVTAPSAQAPAIAAPDAPPPTPVTADAPKNDSPAVTTPKPKSITEAVPAAEGAENTHKVKSGDTLGKIAAASAVEGVTLDQMLVALFNNNRDAFIGGNMNRLRAGKILSIPDAGAVAAVDSKEARKIVVAQSADFNAYRNSLAASAASQAPAEQPAPQSSSGKIAPKVEEKATPASGQDKLQVSRSEAGDKHGKGKGSEEDIVARDKALKEANSRIADLEKNLTDLKKLAELKSQAAGAAQPAAPAAATPAPAKPAAETAPPAADKGVTVAATLPTLSTTAATPAESVSATAAAPAADEQPKQKPKKKFVPPPPEPEPSFIEANLPLVAGGGVVLAAILGFLGFRTWKRKKDAAGQGITVSDLAASSVFGAAVSENADAAVPPSDFGHSTFDSVDTSKEGVDPIQEAEVYMAYGRDGQAEEILLDAKQKDPGNLAVYLKLLEIYVGRKSVAQFNQVANELHARTGGSGAEWDKAVALGRSLDPANPLYGGTAASEAATTHESAASMESTMIMEAPPVQEAPAVVPSAPPAAAAEETPAAMDFDLDLDGAGATPAAAEASDIDFDLDLGAGQKPAEKAAAPESGLDINFDTPAESGNVIDFDIAASSPAAESSKAPAAPAVAESGAEPALDFDFDLGGGSDTPPAPLEQPSPPLDLSSISLDLDAVPASGANGGDSSEVNTKLELAQAYEEMGDREGARELLQEVLAEGSPAQQETARSKLAQLG